MSELGPLNFCTTCREDFGSVGLFDRHRVGKHEYLFDPEDPAKLDGRRCLNVAEMIEKGWTLNTKDRWIDPKAVKRIRAHRSKTSQELGTSALTGTEFPRSPG